jgi:hypothetical protein
VKPTTRRLILLFVPGLFVIFVIILITRVPAHLVAYIQIVDETGAPVSGAVVLPEGLRTKPGPYVSGWYGWRTATNGGVANPPVTTDREGYARVPYPNYVFEQIETGTLCLSVNHPEFVPDRPERIVATAPPAGAPWRVRADYLLNRIMRKALVARPDAVVLKKGATLVLHVDVDGKGGHLFGQVSGNVSTDTDFWNRPEPGILTSRQVGAGPHTVRAVQLEDDGSAWFSETITFTATARQTNELTMSLKRGATVRGALDSTVPRPVKNGRVVANVWPFGSKPQESPPQWHGWTAVSEAGDFSIHSLPEGDLEIVAMCDGFISTNGPGQFQTRYPQKHLLGTNDLSITIGMEPTARLEVQVTDDQSKPLKDVHVMTWPNVRYGEWGSVLLMSDCYNTADWLIPKAARRASWSGPVRDYNGVSDAEGIAVLPNVPATVNSLAADHPKFLLPAVGTFGTGKHRQFSITLTPAQTNRVSIQLEPRDQSPIAHY